MHYWQATPLYYAYILRSTSQPGAIYIGYTGDLQKRLAQHNDPLSRKSSSRYAPWEFETLLAFSTMERAKAFELYLKSNSGKAFMRKRLLSAGFCTDLERFKNGRKQRVAA